jgi:hypothetical protein
VTIPTPSDALYPGFGSYGTMDPSINSPRVQSWNVTFERQIGDSWQASASYLGSYLDRLWGQVHLNPGVYVPGGTSNGNLDQRRVFSLEQPDLQAYGAVVQFDDVGTQDYAGVKLSVRRRATSGVSVGANYTWSTCETDSDVSGAFSQFSAGYQKPDDPGYDRGNCAQNRAHIGNFTLGYLTPQVDNAALRAVASDWRISGILNARSGSWLTVTTTADPAGTGISGRRPNQVNADPYGDRTLDNYLDRDAFAVPAAGTYGDHVNNSIEGPGYWTVDMALSKLIAFGGTQQLELRVEAFNLFDNFNWGDPVTNFNSGTFGRILSQAGSPRIWQFGIKYGF